MSKQDRVAPQRHGARQADAAHAAPETRAEAKASLAAAHSTPRAAHDPDQHVSPAERLVSKAYSLGDNDLARDNLENDLPDADLQDI